MYVEQEHVPGFDAEDNKINFFYVIQAMFVEMTNRLKTVCDVVVDDAFD